TAQLLGLNGLDNRRGLVLLDGVPLNDGFGGWINWGRVPDSIERVEVVPGGSSNLYGTWAMGGVVQILTEQPGPGEHVRAVSRAGNLNTYTESLSGRYGTDRIGLSLGYRWFHTNGFITVLAYQRGPVDRTDDSRHENFAGTLRIAPDASTTVTLGGNLFREDRTVGTALFGEWISTPADRWTVVPSVRWDWWKNFDGRIESESGAVRVPRDNVESVLNPKLAVQYQLTDHTRVGASAYQAFRAPTLNELYRSFSFGGFTFLANENLTPERLTGGDATVESDLLG